MSSPCRKAAGGLSSAVWGKNKAFCLLLEADEGGLLLVSGTEQEEEREVWIHQKALALVCYCV